MDAALRRRTDVLRRLADPARRAGRRAGREPKQRRGVTWLHSYVSQDNKRTFCVYEAPSPEAIRTTAASNDFPVDRITQVRVLDPYFNH